jgi:hypothetical protein
MQLVVRVARATGALISAVLAAGLAFLAIASFGAAISGESGDMWLGAVVVLGVFYAFLAAGAATGAWRLWPRRRSGRTGIAGGSVE